MSEKDFIKSVDFKPLYDYINNLIGLNLTYKLDIKESSINKTYFEIESEEDLAESNNILALAWKSFKIKTFNSKCFERQNELAISGFIDYTYKPHAGGTNGATILTFSYSKSKGWNIRAEKDRYKEMED